VSSLGDRMEKIFQAGGGRGRPTILEVARGLREHFGSNRKAAAAAGVNESTFRRIISGKTSHPKVSTVGAFERVGRVVGTRRINLDDIKIPVTPSRRGERTGRDRELGAKNLKITDPKAADRIRDAYVKGGKEAAAVQLGKEIGDRHYRNWLIPDEMRDLVDAEAEGDYGYAVH
jgi:hypothetical protein